jgi:hypothetical protein
MNKRRLEAFSEGVLAIKGWPIRLFGWENLELAGSQFPLSPQAREYNRRGLRQKPVG